MTLDELKLMGRHEAADIDIQWERIEQDPQHARELEMTFHIVEQNAMELEHMFHQLTNRESVLFEGEETPLGLADLERLLALITNELIAAYTILDVAHRYRSIKALTE